MELLYPSTQFCFARGVVDDAGRQLSFLVKWGLSRLAAGEFAVVPTAGAGTLGTLGIGRVDEDDLVTVRPQWGGRQERDVEHEERRAVRLVSSFVFSNARFERLADAWVDERFESRALIGRREDASADRFSIDAAIRREGGITPPGA